MWPIQTANRQIFCGRSPIRMIAMVVLGSPSCVVRKGAGAFGPTWSRFNLFSLQDPLHRSNKPASVFHVIPGSLAKTTSPEEVGRATGELCTGQGTATDFCAIVSIVCRKKMSVHTHHLKIFQIENING